MGKVLAQASATVGKLENGKDGAQGPKGDSVTVTSTSIQYAISTSGTSTPTQWSNSILAPEQGKFLWTRTTVTFSDGKSAVSYSIAFSGSDGKTEDISGIISSNTPPASPKVNQFWNDTSSVPNVLKVYRANNGWVVYQFSAENIASRSITTDKLSVNAVKSRNIDMAEVTYQVADSSKNLAKNTSLSDVAGLPNSSGWTLPSGVTLVNNALGGTNGILVPAGTTATLVNDLWDATDAISDYVLGLWVKSAGVATITVDGVTAGEGGTYPITTAGDGVWNKMEIKYASTSSNSQLKLTVKAISDTYLARVMLSRRDTKLDGMWLPAPEDGMLNTAKLNDQVTQNFSLSNGQLKSIISNLNSGYSSNFTQNSDGTINQITKGNDLVTAINVSPAGVYIMGDRIQLDGTVNVTQDFYAKGGNFKNLNADNINGGKVKADYIDVANVMTQGLRTTNATIGNTLTMGSSGTITTSYTKSNSFNDFRDVSINYTLTGGYNLNSNGLIFSGNTNVTNIGSGVIPLGGKGFTPVSWDAKTIIDESTITMTASNAKGKGVGTGATTNVVDMPTATLKISPYYLTFSDSATLNSTNVYSGGIRTNELYSLKYASLMNVDIIGKLKVSVDSRKTITIDNGNITMPGMASDGSKTKGFRTAHIQWNAWWGQRFDIFREGDMVYGTVMQRARQDIPRDTVSDETLPVGYRPIWQDSVVNIVNYIGRDTGVVVRPSGKLATVGTGWAPYTERWSFSYITADPFPYGDVYGQ